MKMTRHELVLKVLNCLLPCDNVPFPAMCFSMAASGSWTPVVVAEPLLFGRAIGHVGVKTVFSFG